MKIFILFTLVALTLCDDESSSSSGLSEDPSSLSSDVTEDPSSFHCEPYENKHADDESCLKTTLKEVPALTQALEKLLCLYRRQEEDKTDEYLEEAKRNAIKLGSCTGCTVGELADLQKQLEGVGEEAGGAGVGVAAILTTFANALGLTEPFADTVCDSLSGLLASKCLEHITNSDVPEIADDLNKLFCLAEKKTLDVELVIQTLVDIECVAGNVLGTEDKPLEISVPVAHSITPILQGLIGHVKALDVVGSILDPTLCAVTEPVRDIVDGNNVNILGDAGGIVLAPVGGVL